MEKNSFVIIIADWLNLTFECDYTIVKKYSTIHWIIATAFDNASASSVSVTAATLKPGAPVETVSVSWWRHLQDYLLQKFQY